MKEQFLFVSDSRGKVHPPFPDYGYCGGGRREPGDRDRSRRRRRRRRSDEGCGGRSWETRHLSRSYTRGGGESAEMDPCGACNTVQ